jgi:hypothetical protein
MTLGPALLIIFVVVITTLAIKAFIEDKKEQNILDKKDEE